MQDFEFRTGVIKPVEIFKEAWELIKDQYWLILGVTLLGLLIGGVIPIIIMGPMVCGIYLCMFEKIEGREVKIDMLFKGFDHFVPSLIVSVCMMLPVVVLLVAIYVPMIGMVIAGQKMSESELIPFLIGAVVFELIVAIAMVCFHTLLMFAFPLVADRKLSGFAAIKLSARAVWNNLSGMAGLFGVSFLVAMVGYLVLCVGVYLTLPLIFMANAIAFRRIFPSVNANGYGPPPPTAYEGLG